MPGYEHVLGLELRSKKYVFFFSILIIFSSLRLTFLCLCSMAQTEMMTLPPTLRALAISLRALTLRSTVAMWWMTATDRTASRLSSRKGRHRLSQ